MRPISIAWAKLRHANAGAGDVFSDQNGLNWHSLIAHSADVAACFESLAAVPAIGARLETAAGRILSERDLARLAVLAFYHDIGKANVGFWARQFDEDRYRLGRRHGHIRELAGLFGDRRLQSQAIDALGLAALDGGCGVLQPYLFAIFAHHGKPVTSALFGKVDLPIKSPKLWRRVDGYDPIAELGRIGQRARAWWPNAFTEGGPALPGDSRLIHIFAGLLSLADWIGSDEDVFAYCGDDDSGRLDVARAIATRRIREIGLSPEDFPRGDRTFGEVFGHPTPHPLQRVAGKVRGERLAILEAETGSGKTEAALWRFHRLFAAGEVDGLYFALPTRVAAVEIAERVKQAAERMFGAGAVDVVLALPGYLRAGDLDGTRLPDGRVLWPDPQEARLVDARWAAEAPKRFLTAPIAVGTIDQALLAALQTGHAHLRAASLARSLIVVDEVHASDTYMATVLEQLLANHLGVGGHALLMSATLGGSVRAKLAGMEPPALAEAEATPYPAITRDRVTEPIGATETRKNIAVELVPAIADPEAVARLALEAAEAGASVLVVRNLVDTAIDLHAAVEAAGGETLLFRPNGVAAPHHGRFAPTDRRLLDHEVQRFIGKDRDVAGRIVVGTQTLEQSLDLDADLLISDLCPMDVLLQRFGRLHRHDDRGRPTGFERPRAIVLVPDTPDLSRFRTVPQHGLGHRKDGQDLVYGDVLILEATWRLLRGFGPGGLTIPDMNRLLVERATHGDELDDLAGHLGWAEETNHRAGFRFAERSTAKDHVIYWSKPFDGLEFPTDEAVRTRLGLDRRRVRLEQLVKSPFGVALSEFVIPGHWARSIGADANTAEEVAMTAGGFAFALGGQRFRYDRFGLHCAEGA